MKTEKERQERLLRDVFAEDFDRTEHATREVRLLVRQFRLAYWRRKTNRVLLAVAAMVAIGVFTTLYTREAETPSQTVALPVTSPSKPQLSSTPTISKSPDYLTDKELLSLFPPDSCFLAELDGKQVLVFKDPALAAAVLH